MVRFGKDGRTVVEGDCLHMWYSPKPRTEAIACVPFPSGIISVCRGNWPRHGSRPCPSEGAYVTWWSYEPCHAGPPKMEVIVKSCDKTWPTGEGNGNPLQYSCLANLTDSMKRQKDMTLEDETRSESVKNATGEEQRTITNSSKKMKWLGQSRNDAQLWMCLVVKVKSSAVENSIT